MLSMVVIRGAGGGVVTFESGTLLPAHFLHAVHEPL